MTKEQSKIINDIISNAQVQIKNQTRINVKLICRIIDCGIQNDLKRYFEEICSCWGVDLSFVQDPSRKNDRPVMRKILWMAGRNRHQDVPYNILCALTNVKDHAGVI